MTVYNQNSQNVGNQINVGRDQVIHNLVLVGQFLDFAKIEGLIPKSSAPSDFTTVIDAFDSTFDQRLSSDLTQAAAMAGTILSEIMLRFVPKQSPAALPIRTILLEVPDLLYKKLAQSHFWNAFYEIRGTYASGCIRAYKAEVVWLYSLRILWKKYFNKNRLFGICIFREKEIGLPKNAFLCEDIGSSARQIIVNEITYKQFRIIMAGLVIDLIRMCSIASDDIQFWQSLISLLKIK